MVVLSKVIFVLGCPGSGKGTLCTSLVKTFPEKFFHLSAGDLLRSEREKLDSEHYQVLKNIMSTGKIVPSYITASLLFNALTTETQKYPLKVGLIDGFPRNKQNFDAWTKYDDSVNTLTCVNLECDFETMKKRILERAEKTLKSGNKVRDDDKEELMKTRFEVHLNETIPVINTFHSLNLCHTIEANQSREEIFHAVCKILESDIKMPLSEC